MLRPGKTLNWQTMRRLRDEGRLEDPAVVATLGFIFYGYEEQTSWWCESQLRRDESRPSGPPARRWRSHLRLCALALFRREAVIMLRKLCVVSTTVFLVAGDEQTVMLQLLVLIGVLGTALVLQVRRGGIRGGHCRGG